MSRFYAPGNLILISYCLVPKLTGGVSQAHGICLSCQDRATEVGRESLEASAQPYLIQANVPIRQMEQEDGDSTD